MLIGDAIVMRLCMRLIDALGEGSIGTARDTTPWLNSLLYAMFRVHLRASH